MIIGKFLDDPANAELWMNKRKIWGNRKNDKKKYEQYRNEFERKGLISKSLPYAKEFRQLLTNINDEFVHMNYEYLEKFIRIDECSQDYVLRIP